MDTDPVRVNAWLSSPGSYPARPRTVEQLETHGAWVFIAGDDVYKIKRPVKFPYMDFSTLEQRHRACLRELEINQPHAPGIYFGVTAITREADGSFRFDGAGRVVEWAVHMRRFAQTGVLADMAARGAMTTAVARALADAICAFHRFAPVVSGHDTAAQLRAIAGQTADVLAACQEMQDADGEAVRVFKHETDRALARLAPLLAERAGQHFVRRCHGDLHLGNVVMWEGAPVLFDALEFSEELATIDIGYDLAFAVMDLVHSGQTSAANVLLNRYLWRADDVRNIAGLSAMPLFMALRAAVRAMVAVQRAHQEAGASRRADLDRASGYLRRACGFYAPHRPQLIVIGGLSGTGKSTLAAELACTIAPAPGALHLRSDLERKAMHRIEETDRLPETAYTIESSARVYARVLEKAETALRAGFSVVADAVYANEEERTQIEGVAHRAGVPLRGLWLDAPAEVLMRRIASRRNDASDASPATLARQLRYDTGRMSWAPIDASGTSQETLLRALQEIQTDRNDH